MRDIYIIGSDALPVGKHLSVSVRELASKTVEGCLKDAGLDKSAIQSIHFGNGLWGYYSGQHGIRGHIAMRSMGIDSIPVNNVEGACATGTICVHNACKDILSGLYDCTMAVGVEKLVNEDKQKAFNSFNSYIDIENQDAFFASWDEWCEKNVTVKPPPGADEKVRSPFMDIYAYQTRWHMGKYGTTVEQLAMAASKNHHHSTMNPLAQYRFPLSVEDVLKDVPVVWPLTRSMCSPMGDGAASAIICSRKFLDQMPAAVRNRAVRIASSIYSSGDDHDLDYSPNYVQRAAGRAYEEAGVKPDDIDVAEVHDACIIGEIMQIENLGFCAPGEGGSFEASGAARLGGPIPVNTSGGLISRGHPVSATGLNMINELVTQLRGEAGDRQVKNARCGICENGGGTIGFNAAAMTITILAKD
jgi:acetyl-CoA acetyltransferase